jgi:starch-binding outer membrane protein, SusD/RagB family
MKIRYFLITLGTFLFTACNDFLEPDSLSTFDTKYVFSNAEDARKAVNAIYVHFSHDGFRSRLANNMTGNTDVEHSTGWGSSTARYQIWDLNAQPNNGDLGYVWEIAYKAIRDANICIEGIQASVAFQSTDVELSRKMKNLLGEAYTLRAYWYSMLIFYFGDVPFSNEAPKVGVEFNLPKEDRNVILSAVIKDLIDHEEDMMWADQTDFGIEAGNREYTLGMICRLALQRGGWYLKPDMTMARPTDYPDYYKIANDYAKKLISLKDRELPADFKQVFMNECKFITPVNSDILFEVPFAIGEGDVGWNHGIRVDAGTHSYGSGSNYMAMPPTYLYSFDTLDLRLMPTCGLYMINTNFVQELVSTGNMNISQGKWSRAWLDNPPGPSTNKGTGINWPMLRYADVLLMHAEAENELNGPTTMAKEALRRVRQRAFDKSVWNEKVEQYITDVSTSKTKFFNAIVNERAWEFGGEFTRKYDLIRWNIYASKMTETVDALKKMTDDAVTGTGTLPDYLYVKLDARGNLIFYNLFRKIASAPDASWTRKSWLIDMANTTTTYDEWITKDWARYTHPVRYIFPIPTIGIDNSKGVLKNDGYGF